MKLLLAVPGLMLMAVAALTAEPWDQALESAALDYGKRLETATREIADARANIVRERAPLVARLRESEDRLVAIETELTRLKTTEARTENGRGLRQRENEATAKTFSYLANVAQESLKALESGLLPGENALYANKLESLRLRLEQPNASANPDAALELVDVLLERTRRNLGGHAVAGRALTADDNRVAEGTFAFFGPEVFFASAQGGEAGVVRVRAGAPYPIVHPLADWKTTDAAALATGQEGALPLDPSGGRALRLRQAQGTFLEHVHKGGVVAYLIIGVGVLSLVIVVLKVVDARNLSVNDSREVRPILDLVAQGKIDQAGQLVPSLRPGTREVFSIGLQHVGKTKEALEEHLLALLQEQRLHYERRLPLLTVIATASPLMGLLGTVMGMVKTFSLITVFGTGNAARLSSGISEVLVTTELGLAVAIPTLVAHGFLAHQIQKKLSLLERYASEFVAAAEESRAATPSARSTLL